MANIDTQCKETWVNYFQCKQGAKLRNFVNSLSYGICPKKNIKENNILSSLINVMSRYTVFEDQVTWAYSFAISRDDNDLSYNISIGIGAEEITISGTEGTSEEIVQQLAQEFANYTVAFSTEIVGSTLYVWSYDTGFNDTTETTVNTETNVDISESDLVEDLEVILDIWNCITFEEFSNIVCYAKKFINLKCNCSN